MQDRRIQAGHQPLLPLPKPSLRQRRLLAMGTAAAIVVVGLGAFALLPPVRADRRPRANPIQLAANDSAARARAAHAGKQLALQLRRSGRARQPRGGHHHLARP